MLRIERLAVEVDGRQILHGVDLGVDLGETHVLLGPNGSGKTTLLGAIKGAARYRVVAGRIVFKGEDVTALPLPERARRGIGLAFQRPPVVRGCTGCWQRMFSRQSASHPSTARPRNERR